ncbi:MAG: hypothetical protein ACRDIC_12805 [bacterium]
MTKGTWTPSRFLYIPLILVIALAVLADWKAGRVVSQSPGSLLASTFSQLDFMLDDRAVVKDSDWGSLNMTILGSPDIVYLNLSANGNWVLQNIPVVSIEGPGVNQSMFSYFFLGVNSGQRLDRLRHGLTLTSNVRTSPPAETQLAILEHRTVIFNRGIRNRRARLHDARTSGFQSGAQARSGEQSVHRDFPNQEAGKNECVPVALSNSLQFLKRTHGLPLTDAEVSIANMKRVVGWQQTGAPQQWERRKRDFRPDLITTTITQQIEEVVAAHRRRCDVELSAGTHVAAVVGITPLENGNHTLYVANDLEQGKDDGRVTEIVTYDSRRRRVSGDAIWGNGRVSFFVIECPREGRPTPSPSPTPTPSPSPRPSP